MQAIKGKRLNDNFFSVIILSFFFLIATPAKSFGGDCAGLLYLSPYAEQSLREITQLVKSQHKPMLLITGPPGSGKSQLAAEIYFRLKLHGKLITADPFSTVPDLALTSLFGVVSGAFTGSKTRPGLLEIADGGVVLIDDVDQMPLVAQEALLTFLQTGEYRSVGDTRTKLSTAILVFATNADLDSLVRTGKMRRDFVDRLRFSGIEVFIPPLNQRTEDIIPTAKYLLNRLNEKNKTGIFATNDALLGLLEYDWPGNVRQLEQVVTRAYNIAKINQEIEIRLFPFGKEMTYILGSDSHNGNQLHDWEWDRVPDTTNEGVISWPISNIPNSPRDSLGASLEQIYAALAEARSSQNKNSSTIENRKIEFNVQLRAFFEKIKEIYTSMELQLEVDRFIASFITASIDLEISLQSEGPNRNVAMTKIINKVLLKMGLIHITPTGKDPKIIKHQPKIIRHQLLELATNLIKKNSSQHGQSLNLFDDRELSSLANKNFEALYALMKELGITFKEVTLDEFRTTLNSSP